MGEDKREKEEAISSYSLEKIKKMRQERTDRLINTFLNEKINSTDSIEISKQANYYYSFLTIYNTKNCDEIIGIQKINEKIKVYNEDLRKYRNLNLKNINLFKNCDRFKDEIKETLLITMYNEDKIFLKIYGNR